MSADHLQLTYDGKTIDIRIDRSGRKRLSLMVYPHGEVLLKAPLFMSDVQIRDFAEQRVKWMDKHLRRFEEHPPEPPKSYVNGEMHPYLGKDHRLVLKHASRSQVNIVNGELHITLPDPSDPAAIEKELQKWYRREALRILTPRFWELSEELSKLQLPQHRLRFYRMKRRWGSCSSKGVITLNTELIKKAPELIDYVILHELCHLKVPAHNRAFYALLESVLPDWKTLRRELNGR